MEVKITRYRWFSLKYIILSVERSSCRFKDIQVANRLNYTCGFNVSRRGIETAENSYGVSVKHMPLFPIDAILHYKTFIYTNPLTE